MSRTNQINGENVNGPTDANTTTIRRTLVERGLRQTNNNTNNQNSPSNTVDALATISKQHQDERRELQELNSKLSIYLNHVHGLETFNGQLLAELDDLKEKLGYDSEKVHDTLKPQLQALREKLNQSVRDQILQELHIKRFAFDIYQTQERIHALDGDIANRTNVLEQELRNSMEDLENLRNDYERRSKDLIQQRNNLENLANELDGLSVELLNQRLERLMLENEIQTLREQAAFQDATYQAQREEILSLSVPNIDTTKFYRNELARAITDIRQDFDVLSQTQAKELEEYYRIKTEEIQEKVRAENERKRSSIHEHYTKDSNLTAATFLELNEEYKEVKDENNQLENDFNDTLDDLNRIRDENSREIEKYNIEFQRLQQGLDDKQGLISGILENNVSLRFELSTYRNLLKSEEKRISRIEQEQRAQTLSSPSLSNQNRSSQNQNRTEDQNSTQNQNQNQNPGQDQNQNQNQNQTRTQDQNSNRNQNQNQSRIQDQNQNRSPDQNQNQNLPQRQSQSQIPNTVTQNPSNYKVQKMAIQKAANGPIVFDSIDFVNDCIVITYDKPSGDRQSLENWIIRHKNDQQPDIIYQFPSSFYLQPRQTVKISTKRSPQTVRSGSDVLVADQIETWSHGQVMLTRLIDNNNNEEKATLTQTRVPG